MLYVYANTDDGDTVCVEYEIREEANGRFRWKRERVGESLWNNPLIFMTPLFLHTTALTDRHAERITGLYCPAAWDRLREMVQDSGVWRLPDEKPAHDLWTDSDPDRPQCVLDQNGSVVLDLCKKCGRGECELVEPCCRKPEEK